MDYLSKYKRNNVSKFQAGGPMPAEAPAAPANDIEGMIMGAYESQDPAMALAAINALVEASGQAPATPAAGSGMRMNSTAPMFRKGGKLVR